MKNELPPETQPLSGSFNSTLFSDPQPADGITYTRLDGTVVHAANQQEAIAGCPFLQQKQQESPEFVASIFQSISKGVVELTPDFVLSLIEPVPDSRETSFKPNKEEVQPEKTKNKKKAENDQASLQKLSFDKSSDFSSLPEIPVEKGIQRDVEQELSGNVITAPVIEVDEIKQEEDISDQTLDLLASTATMFAKIEPEYEKIVVRDPEPVLSGEKFEATTSENDDLGLLAESTDSGYETFFETSKKEEVMAPQESDNSRLATKSAEPPVSFDLESLSEEQTNGNPTKKESDADKMASFVQTTFFNEIKTVIDTPFAEKPSLPIQFGNNASSDEIFADAKPSHNDSIGNATLEAKSIFFEESFDENIETPFFGIQDADSVQKTQPQEPVKEAETPAITVKSFKNFSETVSKLSQLTDEETFVPVFLLAYFELQSLVAENADDAETGAKVSTLQQLPLREADYDEKMAKVEIIGQSAPLTFEQIIEDQGTVLEKLNLLEQFVVEGNKFFEEVELQNILFEISTISDLSDRKDEDTLPTETLDRELATVALKLLSELGYEEPEVELHKAIREFGQEMFYSKLVEVSYEALKSEQKFINSSRESRFFKDVDARQNTRSRPWRKMKGENIFLGEDVIEKEVVLKTYQELLEIEKSTKNSFTEEVASVPDVVKSSHETGRQSLFSQMLETRLEDLSPFSSFSEVKSMADSMPLEDSLVEVGVWLLSENLSSYFSKFERLADEFVASATNVELPGDALKEEQELTPEIIENALRIVKFLGYPDPEKVLIECAEKYGSKRIIEMIGEVCEIAKIKRKNTPERHLFTPDLIRFGKPQLEVKLPELITVIYQPAA